MKHLITLFISALFLVSCGNSKSEKENESNELNETDKELIIDVKTIIGKSESELEKILGKAEKVEKVAPSRTPCKENPCNKLFYQNDKFEVVFIDGKSDWITIHNVSNFDYDSKTLTLLGLEETIPSNENDFSINWIDIHNINEVIFFNNGKNKLDYIYIKAFTK